LCDWSSDVCSSDLFKGLMIKVCIFLVLLTYTRFSKSKDLFKRWHLLQKGFFFSSRQLLYRFNTHDGYFDGCIFIRIRHTVWSAVSAACLLSVRQTSAVWSLYKNRWGSYIWQSVEKMWDLKMEDTVLVSYIKLKGIKPITHRNRKVIWKATYNFREKLEAFELIKEI
jgi:hypothetical protein